MRKFYKILFIFLSISIVMLTSFGNLNNKTKAAVVPKLQMVTQPAKEYKAGDRVSFTVTSPNYGGKVEYRVMLWNGTTKTQSELWNTPATGFYYKNWQPAGNYKFTINWPVSGMVPGAYSLTVLTRSVGSPASYDSFVKTDAFWVTSEKEAPTIVSIGDIKESISLGGSFTPPKTVAASMSDGTTKQVNVLWNTSPIDTSKPVIYKFVGLAEGYNKGVNLDLVITPSNSNTDNTPNSPTPVSSDDLEKTISAGDDFKLPETVSVKMSDGSIKDLPVTWDPNSVDTSKSGTYIFNGSIADLLKPIKLTLTINPKLSNIEDINEVVFIGDSYSLPQTVQGIMSDGTKKEYNITWDKSTVNTNTPGTFTYNGTVDGYSEKVILTLNVVSDSSAFGNSPSNIQNGGKFAESNGIIYYANPMDGSMLYKMNSDGFGSKISDDIPSYINVVGSWIYYSNESDNQRLYRIRTDGTGREKINIEAASEITAIGSKIYYKNPLNTLYRMNTDGSSKVKLLNSASNINISDGWIYYISQGIYKTKLDGTGTTLISSDVPKFLIVSGDSIYYFMKTPPSYDGNGDVGLYKIDESGTKTKLSDADMNVFNIYNDNIYYFNPNDKYKLYRMSIDGSSNQRVGNYNESKGVNLVISIINDRIYFGNITEGSSLSVINTDGSGFTSFDKLSHILYVDDINYFIVKGETVDSVNAKVHMSDGSVRTTPVNFSGITFDTSTIGQRTYDVSIPGYNKAVKLTLNVGLIGNTRANIANGGNAVLYDGWMFYNVNGTLYKARPDGSEKAKLAEGGAYYINVINGYVYYVGKFNNIYRMKIDGTEQIKITDKQMINAAIVGGSIIYNNVTSSSGVASMYRMDMDGTVTLNYYADTVGNTKAFAVYDGWIYYNGSYGFGSNMRLYRVKLDGTDKVKLTSDSPIDYINGSGSYVYYALNPSNANAGIYRVNLEELNNNPTTSGTTGVPTPTNPVAAEKIVEDKAIDINVVGDWIYYLNMGDYKYYRAKTDGTHRELIN